MHKGSIRNLVIMLLITALLFLLFPGAAFADSGTTVLVVILVLVGAWILLDKAGYGDQWDSYISLSGASPMMLMKLNPASPGYIGNDINFNYDWLLTDKRQNRVWTGAGMTLNYKGLDADATSLSASDEMRFGGNLMMGFSSEDYDFEMILFTFDDGETTGKLEFKYSF